MGRGLAGNRKNEVKAKAAEVRKAKAFGSEVDPKSIGKAASVHGSACSCNMCGNPRKYYGDPTVQEKRADQGEGEE
jgi:hypothetical protein